MNKRIFGIFMVLVSILCFLAGFSPPASASPPPVEKYKLKNNMTVIMQRIPESPVVSVAMVYRVGSRNERPGINGISHVLEHLLHKNTKQYPKGRMARILNRVGADFNAFTSNDITGFYETLAPEYLELALHIEADRMKNGVITAQDLDLEKKIILAEAAGFENKPAYQLWKQVRAAAYLQHPYMWPVQGYPDDIKQLALNQVKWYYNSNYIPENAVLAIVGNFDTAKTKVLINKFFANAPNPQSGSFLKYNEEPPSAEKRVIMENMGNIPMIHVAYHSPAVSDQDLYAMSVVDMLLTGGRTSRLQKALIEKGYCSQFTAWLDTNQDPGLYYIRLTLKPGMDYDLVESALYEELEKLKTEPISNDELEKAKIRLKTQFTKAKDSVTNQARLLAWYEAIHSYKYLTDYPTRLDKVTTEDVRKTAEKYFVDNARVTGRLYPKDSIDPVTPDEIDIDEPQELKETDETGWLEYKEPLRLGSLAPYCIAGLKSPDYDSTLITQQMENTGNDNPILLAAKPAAKPPAKKPDPKAKAKPKPKPSPKPKPKPSPPPPYKPPIPDVKPFDLNYKRHVLPNGLVLLIYENRTNPSVTIRGLVKAGGIYEPPEKAGLAKVVAYLMMAGSTGLNSSTLSEELDMMGVDMRFNATLQNCAFSIWAPSENLEKLVPILSRVLSTPEFPTEQVNKIKSRMLVQQRYLDSRPSVVSTRDFFSHVFPEGHPFHHFRWGTEETLNGITREDVADFYNRHYLPNATMIAVSGDVKAGEVITLFEQAFAQWKTEGTSPQLMMPVVTLPDKTEEKINNMPDSRRVEVVMGHKGVPRNHPDFYKVNLMNYILGGAPLVSRLDKEIRYKGLAYKIYSRLDTSIGDGPWSVSMGVSKNQTQRAISLVRSQMKDLQNKPLSKLELEDARFSLIGKLPVELETNKNIAAMLLTIEYYNLGKDYIKDYCRIYKEMKPADIQEAAKKYLYPDNMNVIISGPWE